MEITANTPVEEVEKIGKTCKLCGHCCKYGAGFAQSDELKKIAKHLKITEDELKTKYFDQKNIFNKLVYQPKIQKKDEMPFGPCIFLKEDRCEIHEVKPLHCRVGNCSTEGESLSEWYTINYLVNKTDQESIREWNTRLKVKPTIKGGSAKELVNDDEKLKKILNYGFL